MNKSRSGPRA